VLRVCSSGVEVQLDQPVVEDRKTGVLQAAIGDPTTLKVTTGGMVAALPADGATVDVTAVRIEGPTLSLVAPRATIARQGRELRLTPAATP
jgi:hypothetical protein